MKKFIAYSLLLIGVLPIATIAFFMAANWRDEEPNDVVRNAVAHYTPPTDQQFQNNGTVIIVGFDAPAPPANSADFNAAAVDYAHQAAKMRLDVEIKRKQFFDNTPYASGMPITPDFKHAIKNDDVLPPSLQCKAEQTLNCHAWYVEHAKELTNLSDAQRAALARLTAAANAQQFISIFPRYQVTWSPYYQPVMRTQELQLAQASLLWNAGRRAQAIGILETQNKLIQRSGNAAKDLLTSMITLAMQYRSLRWLSNVIASDGADLPADIQSRIRTLVAQPVIKLRPGLEGEMVEMVNMYAPIGTGSQDWALLRSLPGEEPSRAPWLVAQFNKRTFLRWETMNEMVKSIQMTLPLLDMPASKLDAESARFVQSGAALLHTGWGWLGARNCTGHFLLDVARPDYTSYMRRVHDIEGYRRLLSLQLAAKELKVQPSDMSAWLAKSPPEFRHPFTGEPMQWDAATNSLVYQGRQQQTQNPERSSTYRIAF